MSSMIPIRSFLTSPAGSNRSPEGTYMNQNSQEYLHHFAQSSTVTSGMLFLRYLGISQASVHMEHWYWQSEGSGPNSSFIICCSLPLANAAKRGNVGQRQSPNSRSMHHHLSNIIIWLGPTTSLWGDATVYLLHSHTLMCGDN
jgi:hypothetical protein